MNSVFLRYIIIKNKSLAGGEMTKQDIINHVSNEAKLLFFIHLLFFLSLDITENTFILINYNSEKDLNIFITFFKYLL